MRLKLRDLPKSVVQQYNMETKATRDGYVHVDIRRGMYGLPQAWLITHQLLEKMGQQAGISAKQDHTGTLDAQLAPDLLLAMC